MICIAVGLGVCVTAAAAWWLWDQSEPAVAARPSGDNSSQGAEKSLRSPNSLPTGGEAPGPSALEKPVVQSDYLGSQACAACHDERVAEFQTTRHFRTSRLPQADDMPAGFKAGQGTHTTRDPTLRFEMTSQGGKFAQAAIQDTPGGEQRMSQEIALVYGAGAGDEVYHYWHGDQLHQLPIAWMYPLENWINAPGYMDGTADFSSPTLPRCLECHTTWFGHVPGTPNQYNPHNFILGVTCERCHGPGREHVAFHEAHPKATKGQAIVFPPHLSRDRQLDICSQCHSNANKHRGPAFTYRPGEPLDDYFRSDVAKRPEHDHTANQVEYLRESKCFQASETLTCTTCHNPHQLEGPSNSGSILKSCLVCHQPDHCGDRPNLPEAVRDQCIDCHMPKRAANNVWFSTKEEDYVPLISRHDHKIAVHPTARQEVLLAWHRTQDNDPSRAEAGRLEAALAAHWLAEAERLLGEYRFLAAIAAYRESLRHQDDPATRDKLKETVAIQVKLDADMTVAVRLMAAGPPSFPEAKEKLEAVLRAKPDMAAAHGRLGTLHATLGKKEEAIASLQAVAAHDPDDAYGHSMLGWLAYLDGRNTEAIEAYRLAGEIEPFSAKINVNMGLALGALNRMPEAAERFREALVIDPNNVEALQRLAMALNQQGRPEEALPHVLRAAELTRYQRLETLSILANSYAGVGDFDKAAATAQKALVVAEKNNPANSALLGSIRQRLEQYQARARGDAEG
ncbi:MAG: tetratricopeptide repeat protein [Pirellulales bacterium]